MRKDTMIVVCLLCLFAGVMFWMRVYFPYDQVFKGDWIKFTSIDAYYYMRLVDNVVHNFPHLTYFDPYFSFPNGAVVSGVHFFAIMVGAVAWFVGLGHPSQQVIDTVGVFIPPILATLTVIPVFVIGKVLFNKWAGLISAGLVAVMPGEFLGRSILGFTDHHIAEVLLSALVIMFFVLANRAGTSNRKLLLYGLMAGLMLGVYLITWSGGTLLVFVIAIYLVAQFIINHFKGKSSVALLMSSSVILLSALFIYLTVAAPMELKISITFVALLPLALYAVSRAVNHWGLKRWHYPISLAVLGGFAVFVLSMVSFETAQRMVGHLTIFVPNPSLTTIEAQPMFIPLGEFTTRIAWGCFTTSLYIAPIAFGVLVWLYIRSGCKENNWLLLLVWSVVMFMAMVAQRRFAYYVAVNSSLLVGFVSWQLLYHLSLKEDKAKKLTKIEKQYRWINIPLVFLFVLSIITVPNILKSKDIASMPSYAPTDAWQSSLLWMRDNTPDPLNDTGYLVYGGGDYYGVYDEYKYPETAYGVASWWDYGYWITRIAHRIPSANPTQTASEVVNISDLLLSHDNGNGLMEEMGSNYVVLDYAVTNNKFHAVVKWAGHSLNEYVEIFYLIHEGQLRTAYLYYPQYYKSLGVRLYNFDGKEVKDERPIVVKFTLRRDNRGNLVKQITGSAEFATYKDAVMFVSQQPDRETFRVVGGSPFISPIPLKALTNYELVYSSRQTVGFDNNVTMPEVKIFEYGGGE